MNSRTVFVLMFAAISVSCASLGSSSVDGFDAGSTETDSTASDTSHSSGTETEFPVSTLSSDEPTGSEPETGNGGTGDSASDTGATDQPTAETEDTGDTGTSDTGTSDTGTADTGTSDTGTSDTGTSDTGTADTGTSDTGTADTGTSDTGTADTGTADTGTADTGTADTGTADTGTADTGTADTGTADTGTADTGTADTGTADTETDCPPACTIGCDTDGTCLTCPGEMWNEHCYWYVSTLRTWQAAENDCVSGGGHLVAVNDMAESDYLYYLILANAWTGLHDPATESLPVSGNDTCENAQNVSAAGGTYTGNTSSGYADNAHPSCVLAGDDRADAFFTFEVATSSQYFFSTNGSSYDSVVAVFRRASGSGATGCLGEEVACNDDYYADFEADAGVDVRLEPGSYVAIVDGSTASGAFRLDVRRFVFTSGSDVLWTNWNILEPNNNGAGEDCAEMLYSDGLWNDLSCTMTRAYVCELSR